MALPDSNISVAMVKAELGASTNDVGQLCIHPNVNKWSKWKPVRHGSVVPITEAQLQGVMSGFQYVSYGTALGVVSEYDSLPSRQYEFLYQKPRGADYNEPYRLGDFRNYGHQADKFYNIGGFKTPVFPSESNLQYWISITNKEGNLKMSDLGWEGYKFGVVVVQISNNAATYRVSDTFSNPQGTWYVNIPMSGLSVGSYRAYSFVTDPQESNFFLLEDGYLGQFSILTSTLQNNSSGYVYTNSGGYNFRVSYTISLYNQSPNPVTINNLTMQIRYADSNGSLDFGEVEKSFGNITIQPMTSYVYTDEESACLDLLSSKPGYPRLVFTPDPASRVVTLNRPEGI